MYRVIYTHLFEKKIKKFKKDKGLVADLKKKIEKLLSDPFIGKPLEYPLVNFRSIRIKGKYRLVYKLDENDKELVLVPFGHRKDIYQLMVLSSKKGGV
ncbi:type II toxin-antitoxin system RelE family toxin [Candidatus Methanoperedens nitratireducens]|uniref:Addiction module toxin, RelE/StbE family n=1 Tax=Candidatus Methanoperedens nitratireducens TaxID=1392998 RepID=A0A284VUK1_9EURY